MSNTTRIKCAVCSNEVGSSCTVKKCKIAINKRRICKSFAFDEAKASVILQAKVKAETTITTTMRPDWYHDKSERQKARREAIATYKQELAKAEQLEAEKSQVDFTKPDCLANIRSTVSED